MAASTALPPFFRMSRPMIDAGADTETTMPLRPCVVFCSGFGPDGTMTSGTTNPTSRCLNLVIECPLESPVNGGSNTIRQLPKIMYQKVYLTLIGRKAQESRPGGYAISWGS